MGGNGEKLRKLVLVCTKAKYTLTLWCSHSTPQYILSERPTHIHQMTHGVFVTAVFIKAPNGNQYRCLSTKTQTNPL